MSMYQRSNSILEIAPDPAAGNVQLLCFASSSDKTSTQGLNCLGNDFLGRKTTLRARRGSASQRVDFFQNYMHRK